MQTLGRVPAAQVADELEVSLATARRDLEALSMAGVPVYSQPGRGGGWSLVGGARTDLTGLTAREATALFLLAGPASTVSPAVRSALRKLVRALPETFRQHAEAADDGGRPRGAVEGAVAIDGTAWGRRNRDRPELVDQLLDTVVRRRRVLLDYRSRGRGSTHGTVDPWGLVDKDETWYVIAGTTNGLRTFRVDRIVVRTALRGAGVARRRARPSPGRRADGAVRRGDAGRVGCCRRGARAGVSEDRAGAVGSGAGCSIRPSMRGRAKGRAARAPRPLSDASSLSTDCRSGVRIRCGRR